MPLGCSSSIMDFNSRAREGATLMNQAWQLLINTSIHAPVRVRRQGTSELQRNKKLQFTRP